MKENKNGKKKEKKKKKQRYTQSTLHGIRCLQRCLLYIYCVMLEIFVTARSHVGRYTQRPFENPRLYRRRYSRRRATVVTARYVSGCLWFI